MWYQCGATHYLPIRRVKELDQRRARVSPSSDSPGSGGCVAVGPVQGRLRTKAQIPNSYSSWRKTHSYASSDKERIAFPRQPFPF